VIIVYGIVLGLVLGQRAIYVGLLREICLWPFAGQVRADELVKEAQAQIIAQPKDE
jgi:hypothetical protein